MQKKILAIGSDLLFNAAVLSLLQEQEDLVVLRLSTSELVSAAKNEAFNYPDTIVIDENTMTRDRDSIIKFLDRYAQCRAIIVNLSDNKLEIYDKQRHEVRKFDDFLSVL